MGGSQSSQSAYDADNAETVHAVSPVLPEPSPAPPPGPTNDSNPQHDAPIRILSLDGGGMRGVTTLMLLKELENRLGSPIRDHFDLICGTSTGGLIAVALGLLDMSVDKVLTLYREMGATLFETWTSKKIAGLLSAGARHNTLLLEKLLKETAGDRTMDQPVNTATSKKVFVVAADVTVRPASAYLFRSYTVSDATFVGTQAPSSVKIWQALRATSAAPTYFEPMLIDGAKYIDGGVVANNPVEVALAEARALWPNAPIGCVLSLGTGAAPLRRGSQALSPLIRSLDFGVLDLLTDRSAPDRRMLALSRSAGFEYDRIDPVGVLEVSMDTADCFHELQAAARRFASTKTGSSALDSAVMHILAAAYHVRLEMPGAAAPTVAGGKARCDVGQELVLRPLRTPKVPPAFEQVWCTTHKTLCKWALAPLPSEPPLLWVQSPGTGEWRVRVTAAGLYELGMCLQGTGGTTSGCQFQLPHIPVTHSGLGAVGRALRVRPGPLSLADCVVVDRPQWEAGVVNVRLCDAFGNVIYGDVSGVLALYVDGVQLPVQTESSARVLPYDLTRFALPPGKRGYTLRLGAHTLCTGQLEVREAAAAAPAS